MFYLPLSNKIKIHFNLNNINQLSYMFTSFPPLEELEVLFELNSQYLKNMKLILTKTH